MAEEIAALGLKVESSGVQEATDSLEGLAQVAPKAEKAIEATGNSAANASKSLATLGQGAGAGLNAVGSGAEKAQSGLDRIGRTAATAEKAMQGVSSSGAGLTNVAGGVRTVAGEMDRLNQQMKTVVLTTERIERTSQNSFGAMEKAALRVGAIIGAAFSLNALKGYTLLSSGVSGSKRANFCTVDNRFRAIQLFKNVFKERAAGRVGLSALRCGEVVRAEFT